MIISRSTHVAANGIILLFSMAEQYSIVYICTFFLIQSSVDGHLGCFSVLAVVNSAAMNIWVHVCLFLSGPHPWHMEVLRLGVKSEL